MNKPKHRYVKPRKHGRHRKDNPHIVARRVSVIAALVALYVGGVAYVHHDAYAAAPPSTFVLVDDPPSSSASSPVSSPSESGTPTDPSSSTPTPTPSVTPPPTPTPSAAPPSPSRAPTPVRQQTSAHHATTKPARHIVAPPPVMPSSTDDPAIVFGSPEPAPVMTLQGAQTSALTIASTGFSLMLALVGACFCFVGMILIGCTGYRRYRADLPVWSLKAT